MDKVEKFKELYIKTLNQSRRFGIFGINDEDYEQYDKDKQELIKMYKEKQEKPVIRCSEYEIVEIEDKLFYILWKGKFDNQTVVTHSVEEKDDMLITDDFIFIKIG